MVAGWYVNGKKVENELSNTCVIEKLDKKVHVTVQFTQYIGYALPVSGEGYALTGTAVNVRVFPPSTVVV